MTDPLYLENLSCRLLSRGHSVEPYHLLSPVWAVAPSLLPGLISGPDIQLSLLFLPGPSYRPMVALVLAPSMEVDVVKLENIVALYRNQHLIHLPNLQTTFTPSDTMLIQACALTLLSSCEGLRGRECLYPP